MATPIFPAHLFNPQTVRRSIERKTLSGGTNLVGVEDTVIIDGGGRWLIEYGGIGLDDPETLRAWDAWNGYLAAGTEDVLVPLVSINTAPCPRIGQALMQPSDIYADDPLFPTVVRYQAPYIEARLIASAGLRATTLQIQMLRGSRIMGGEYFGLGDRAYRIRQRLTDTLFKIEPPLRGPVAAGTAVNFDWPYVRCRAAAGEDWSPAVEYGAYADTEIRFVEVIQ